MTMTWKGGDMLQTACMRPRCTEERSTCKGPHSVDKLRTTSRLKGSLTRVIRATGWVTGPGTPRIPKHGRLGANWCRL